MKNLILNSTTESSINDIRATLKLPKIGITLSALTRLLVWVIPILIKAFERHPLSSPRRLRMARRVNLFFDRLSRKEIDPSDPRIKDISSLSKWLKSRVDNKDTFLSSLKDSADGRMIMRACEYLLNEPDTSTSGYKWITSYNELISQQC